MLFQEPQHPDVFARAIAIVLRFQPPPQNVEALGQDPALQRSRLVQRTRLAFQQRQIVQGLKGDLLLLPDPPVPRHDFSHVAQDHFAAGSFRHDRVMREGHRHRVVVVVKAHQRERTGRG